MRVIARPILRQFASEHPDAEGPLDTWYHLLKRTTYRTSHEIKADFPTASFLGDNKTVFNIGGNKYRLVVHVRYDIQCAYILAVLTHVEYDRRTRKGTL